MDHGEISSLEARAWSMALGSLSLTSIGLGLNKAIDYAQCHQLFHQEHQQHHLFLNQSHVFANWLVIKENNLYNCYLIMTGDNARPNPPLMSLPYLPPPSVMASGYVVLMGMGVWNGWHPSDAGDDGSIRTSTLFRTESVFMPPRTSRTSFEAWP